MIDRMLEPVLVIYNMSAISGLSPKTEALCRIHSNATFEIVLGGIRYFNPVYNIRI